MSTERSGTQRKCDDREDEEIRLTCLVEAEERFSRNRFVGMETGRGK